MAAADAGHALVVGGVGAEPGRRAARIRNAPNLAALIGCHWASWYADRPQPRAHYQPLSDALQELPRWTALARPQRSLAVDPPDAYVAGGMTGRCLAPSVGRPP